ncbi:MAG: substrate-binding domain-containing protein [Saprospiraceae bacterium]|nr:substrate-binding domain-containing protein [Saprospiraceae bacterium]
MKYKTLIFIALISWLTACQEKGKDGKVLDTITTGKIRIMVDEGYQPVIASCIDVFDSIYRTAKIDAVYTSEGEAMKGLLDDSVQVVIVGRKLTQEELGYFESRGFTPPQTPIAYDALAFVLNPANPDSVFTVEQITDMLTGKTSKWSQLNPKSKLGDIQIVFDNPLSGTLRYVKDSIIRTGAPITSTAAAVKTNEEVINYVKQKKNAIGIIAANWISDTDDGGVQMFKREIRIADIAEKAGEEGYGPNQAYLATHKYPFKRCMYVINAQARRNGLGAGLASYLAGDAQRIMLKDGLLPANAVTRLVKVSKE